MKMRILGYDLFYFSFEIVLEIFWKYLILHRLVQKAGHRLQITTLDIQVFEL